jgi:uncharacterized CHY-type Zn-finger protein
MVRYPTEKEKEGLLSRLGERVTVTLKSPGIPGSSKKTESEAEETGTYRTLNFRLDAVNSYGIMGRVDNGEQAHFFFLDKWEESGTSDLEHKMHRNYGYDRKIISIKKGEKILYTCSTEKQKHSDEKNTQQILPSAEITCGYCNKRLDSVKPYQYSLGGGKYCNKECFNMFTED